MKKLINDPRNLVREVLEGLVDTTPGRVIFNTVIPDELGFVNQVMDRKGLKALIAQCYRELGPELLGDHGEPVVSPSGVARGAPRPPNTSTTRQACGSAPAVSSWRSQPRARSKSSAR